MEPRGHANIKPMIMIMLTIGYLPTAVMLTSGLRPERRMLTSGHPPERRNDTCFPAYDHTSTTKGLITS